MSLVDRIERLGRSPLGERALRIAILAELREAIPHDWFAWLLTDPETGVGTSPLAAAPDMSTLPTLIKLKYLTTTDRWTSMPAGAVVTRTTEASDWREFVGGFGVTDVLSGACRDAHGCWGFIDLWRVGGTFTPGERDLLAAVLDAITSGVRARLADAFVEVGPSHRSDQPVVALLDDDLHLATMTAQTDDWLRILLPAEHGHVPVPAAVYNVAAQLLANEAGVDSSAPWARAHLRDGIWITLRAARMSAGSASRAIVVTAGLTAPAERTDLYARVIGLTERESHLLGLLIAGADTRELAAKMFISEHTVQDHLKAIFAKAGTRNRRRLVARATGAA